MATSSSRLVIAGLSGDSGKTIVTLSVLAALRQRDISVSVFKKGPDYIDPAWLSATSQSVCRNLDTYLVDPNVVFRNFVVHSDGSRIAVVEGNRGVYDGRDAAGTHSTAALARLLSAPVVLVVDATKATRTVAAIVKGCIDFEPGVKFAGVVLNRVAGKRHLKVLEESIETHTGVPVVGAIPKLPDDAPLIPGRHLGLITPAEYKDREDLAPRLRGIADDFLDVDRLIEIADSAGPISCDDRVPSSKTRGRVRIGFFRDSVFTFYYPENLEALEAGGARLVPVSSVADKNLPDIDALYIGGGFPETQAEQLTRNKPMMISVKKAALGGLPVYAECGGLIYLANSLRCDNTVYPMAGLFPIDLTMQAKPVGHGYTVANVDAPNPFYAVGTTIRGHEFHYSGPDDGAQRVESCLSLGPGVGVGGGRDGLVRANTLACYTHVHASGVETWADSMISRARDYASQNRRRASSENIGKRPKLEAI